MKEHKNLKMTLNYVSVLISKLLIYMSALFCINRLRAFVGLPKKANYIGLVSMVNAGNMIPGSPDSDKTLLTISPL